MTAFFAQLAKIPLPRVIVLTLLALLAFAVVEQLPWTQGFIEHWSNMEGTPK